VRRFIQIAVLLLLLLLLLLLIHLTGPLFETVDHWDDFAQGGDDLVLSVLSVIVGLGLTLLAGFFLRLVFRPSLASSLLSPASLRQRLAAFLDALQPAPFVSPPVPLRI
jgi:hypothetical protein